MATINNRITECPECMTPNYSKGICEPIAGCTKKSKTLSFQDIAAGYVVANDPNQVRQLLVSNGIVANIQSANLLSSKQLVDALITYYKANGTDAYLQLLRQFSPNTSTPNWTNDQAVMSVAKDQIYSLVPMAAAIRDTQIRSLSFSDWFTPILDAIEGSKSSTTAPTVVTTTKASPALWGLVIGGVLILGILAYVVVKS